jgi:hypothetical protein
MKQCPGKRMSGFQNDYFPGILFSTEIVPALALNALLLLLLNALRI